MISWIIKTLFIILLLENCNISVAQNNYTITGKVVDKKNEQAIPFAKVYNKSIGQGTLTEENGSYSIPAGSLQDTLVISFIGFESRSISELSLEPVLIQLNESLQMISEVVASAKSNEYLYDILLAVKKNLPKNETNTKAYFELKTYIDSQQIEMMEGYYNLHLNDYNIDKMELKAGRFALKKIEQTNFVSLESSKAIILLKLFANNEYYPSSPTDFKKRQLHKKFRLKLEKRYLDNDQNTIYVLNYAPIDSSSNYFNGQIWIDSNNNRLLKITENVIDAKRHPFISYTNETDSLNAVSFSINKTYRFEQDNVVLEHIDFDYSLRYFSNSNSNKGIKIGGKQSDYVVSSKSILMAYDTTLFQLPSIRFPVGDLGDYYKISSLPYNSFFWDNNTENKVSKTKSENEFYFKNENSARSDNFKFSSSSNEKIKNGFEKPYIVWSGKRILFREELEKIEAIKRKTTINNEKYRLSVQLYLDVNTYNDSTNILTKTIIDPFESFYYLPIDNTTHCFINIYFDLMEIERRKLNEKLILASLNHEDLTEVYNSFMINLERYSSKVLKSLQHGQNIRELIAQNDYVFQKLGIDNIKLFGL